MVIRRCGHYLLVLVVPNNEIHWRETDILSGITRCLQQIELESWWSRRRVADQKVTRGSDIGYKLVGDFVIGRF